MKYPENHKEFYESFYDKKMNQKEYEWAMKEEKWLDDLQDGWRMRDLDKPPKNPVQQWKLITKDELLKKHGRGTMWVFIPLWRTESVMAGTFQDMQVKKINISHAGKGFTYHHEYDVMDLGEMHKDTTRGMWDELVASGEYIEYNENPIPQKNSNYALEA